MAWTWIRSVGMVVVAVVVAACGGGRSDRAEEERLQVVGAPEVQRTVADARGRVVLVNVWATWCDPCREEFPALVRLQRELPPGDFRLVLVSADFSSQRPQVERFLGTQGVDFVTYLKSQGDDDFIAGMSPSWSGALPASWLYRRDGSLAEFWEGGTTYEAFSTKVRGLLDEPRPGGR